MTVQRRNNKQIPGTDIVRSLFRNVFSLAGKNIDHFMKIMAMHGKGDRQMGAVRDLQTETAGCKSQFIHAVISVIIRNIQPCGHKSKRPVKETGLFYGKHCDPAGNQKKSGK